MLNILPCLDSAMMSAARQQELNIPRHVAEKLGTSALQAAAQGYFYCKHSKVDWRSEVEAARSGKVSVPPQAALPTRDSMVFTETCVQVTNETTLGAARRFVERGLKPLALNFANGIHPGGGFLHGSRAQEEVLCRSSALYETLVDDPMYEAHRRRARSDSTDWLIYSPDVPVFRTDSGIELEHPWSLSIVSCAAPYAYDIDRGEARQLLRRRIHRVLTVAGGYGHTSLVLGAWGCGAFGNDPRSCAEDFRDALEAEFIGSFSDIVFAISDWSPKRRFLGPFRDVFSPTNTA